MKLKMREMPDSHVTLIVAEYLPCFFVICIKEYVRCWILKNI